MIVEGNAEMGAIVKWINIDESKLFECQSKISSGVKRRAELSLECDSLSK